MNISTSLLKSVTLGLVVLLIISCDPSSQKIILTVENELPFDRTEVVSVPIDSLRALLDAGRVESGIVIREKGTENYRASQWVDDDGDGHPEELLFMPSVESSGKKSYELFWTSDASKQQPASEFSTFSRFVPERTDDYAWENDRVAFRTFGPEAQRLKEASDPNGTLSSGIDVWLKRVSHLVIDKWYKGNLDEPGYYHIDHGEGYDPFHVGTSRGVGGIGIWENDSLLTSKNFTSYRTICTGPLRTIFELSYAPWSNYNVREKKRITLDVGSNFSKFDVELISDNAPNYCVGITTHNQNAIPNFNLKNGWFGTWEAIDSASLGVGVVISPTQITDAFVVKTEVPDQSQMLILSDSTTQRLVYYSGYAWSRSGQVTTSGDWDQMLEKQAKILQSPLKLKFK